LPKKFWLIFIIIILTLASGCWGRIEVNQAAVLIGGGWDRATSGRIMVTAQTALASTNQPFTTVTAVGDTVSAAFRNTTLFSPRKQLPHHITVHVLGEDMAGHLTDVLDLLVRAETIRETGDIFIARGATAREVLEVPTPIEKLPAQGLVSMIRTQDPGVGLYTEITIGEFLGKIAAPGVEPVIPGIEIVEEQPGKKRLQLSGMAVIKKGKLVGWLNEPESRGYRWLRPKRIRGGIKILPSPVGGKPVALETLRAKSKIKPEIDSKGRIIMSIDIRETANFYEERDTDNLLTPENLKRLEQAGSRQIEQEVLAAVKKARELDSDIFGFGLALSRTYPREWKQIEPDWEHIFPTVEVKVDAQSEIKRSGLLTRILTFKN